MASLCKMMMLPKNLLRVIGSSVNPHRQSSFASSIFVRYQSTKRSAPQRPPIHTNPPQHHSISPSSNSTDQIRDVATSNPRSSAAAGDLAGATSIIGDQNIASTVNAAQVVAN
ncbi:OLC1v1033880C1 [Oldenlandia corymbosa var. corymbosa]|uniref:OLC1v1033880C1 n=1 Tax=Oldenlandia corymbosa var. corymbosa TaxID=529605 RepID=A0AAV1CPF0_OLDCO|nr:OLC1v1033880C1 [Oldenlandia corymbosa var. corymbosa]